MKSEIQILTEAACMRENILYFFSSEFNGLFAKNIIMGEVENLGSVPGEKYDQTQLYTNMLYWDSKLYLIPLRASNAVVIYDILGKEFNKIALDDRYDECDWKYQAAVIVSDKLFIFGVKIPEIICVDCKTNKVDYIKAWNDEKTNTTDIFFRKQLVVKEDIIWIPFCDRSALLELDTLTMNCTIHIIGKETNGFAAIVEDDGCFILAPRNVGDYIIRFNPLNEDSEKVAQTYGERSDPIDSITIDNGMLKVYTLDSKKISVKSKSTVIVNGIWHYLGEALIGIMQFNELEKTIYNQKKTGMTKIITLGIPKEFIKFRELFSGIVRENQSINSLKAFMDYL